MCFVVDGFADARHHSMAGRLDRMEGDGRPRSAARDVSDPWPPSLRRRVRAVGIHVAPRRAVIYERRHAAWALSLLVVAAAMAIYGFVDGNSAIPPPTRTIVEVLVTVIAALLVLRWLPWQLRAVVDADTATCTVTNCFFYLPLQKRRSSFDGMRFVPGRAELPVIKTEQSSELGSGCLLALLGPLGMLISFLRLISAPRAKPRSMTTVTWVEVSGLVLEPSDGRSGDGAQLVLHVKDLDSVEEATFHLDHVLRGL